GGGGFVVSRPADTLTVSRPRPLWSEPDPEQWWRATGRAVKGLGRQQSLSGVRALGIAGPMHGATLLDSRQHVLRPAILWNYGRCSDAFAWLVEQLPTSPPITGNLRFPGVSSPTLSLLHSSRPTIFQL
ncbi:FGGY family carbohydrate kinase, partial [Salmonella enterica]|uniref:FGGY family carbohydrate kinase n=1 Tax=Salmonella enterica TaxID=28901 RepID=UPI00398C7071